MSNLCRWSASVRRHTGGRQPLIVPEYRPRGAPLDGEGVAQWRIRDDGLVESADGRLVATNDPERVCRRALSGGHILLSHRRYQPDQGGGGSARTCRGVIGHSSCVLARRPGMGVMASPTGSPRRGPHALRSATPVRTLTLCWHAGRASRASEAGSRSLNGPVGNPDSCATPSGNEREYAGMRAQSGHTGTLP